MGIRIHKVLGYGLNNLKNKDPRIQPDFFDRWGEHGYDGTDFIKWLKANKKPAKVMLSTVLGVEPFRVGSGMWACSDIELNTGSLIHCDQEYGMSKVMVLSSIETKDWYRYDNIIDYIESSPQAKCIDLFKTRKQTGIYPYEGMTLIPGRRNIAKELGLCKTNSMSGGTYNQLVGNWSKKLPPINDSGLLTHLKNDWVPQIPEAILLFTLYARIFREPLMAYQLRPLLYTWWG